MCGPFDIAQIQLGVGIRASRERRAVSGSAPLVAVIGVVGLALESRIVAGADTRAVCSGDGRTLATSLAYAVEEGCRGLISFGIAGGLSPDLRTGTCIVGSTIISETAQLIQTVIGREVCCKSFPVRFTVRLSAFLHVSSRIRTPSELCAQGPAP